MNLKEVRVLVSPQEKYYDNIISVARSFSRDKGIICFITVNKLYSVLIKDFKDAGISTENFLFVDAVTKSINKKIKTEKNCIFLDSSSDLTKLSITLNEVLSYDKVTGIIFDSVSTLLVYNKDTLVFKFIHSLANNIKQHGKAGVLVVSEGETSDRIINELSMYADTVVKKGKGESLLLDEDIKNSDLELVYIISHEMRTPLTSIISLIPFLKKGKIGKVSSKQSELLDLIYFDARRMGILIDNLINVSEIDKGLIISSIKEFNISELITDVWDSLKFMAEKKKILISYSLGKDAIIKADRSRIKQAISNLFINSMKYSPEGGKIEVAAKKDGLNVIFSVKDNGPGVKPEDIPILFDKPNYSQQQYGQNESGGKALSGLKYGLYIARKIIEAHGGKIWTESEFGKGAKFYFLIPAQQNA